MTVDIGQYGFYDNLFKYSLKFLPYPETFFPITSLKMVWFSIWLHCCSKISSSRCDLSKLFYLNIMCYIEILDLTYLGPDYIYRGCSQTN